MDEKTGNELEEEGAVAIAAALKGNKSLKSIILSENNLGSGGATLIAHALKYNKTLSGIDLSNNGIFEDGIKKIGELLLESESLTEIVLSGNFVGDEGAKVLAQVVGKNRIRSLYLQNSEIGDEGVSALLDTLSNNTSLEELDVTLNNFSTPLLIRLQQLKNIDRGEKKGKKCNVSWMVEDFDYNLLDTEFIQAVISHFGFEKICECYLEGGDLMPLISNEVLLPHLRLPSDPHPFLHSLFQEARKGSGVEEKRRFLRGMDLLIAMFETQLSKEEDHSIDSLFSQLSQEGEGGVEEEEERKGREKVLEEMALPLLQHILSSKLLSGFPSEDLLDLSSLSQKKLFTFVRYKTLQLVGLFFKTKETGLVYRTLIQNKVLPLLVDLFFSFSWNNFVHNEIADVFLTVLSSTNQEMLLQLFVEANFLERVVKVYKEESKKEEIGKHIGFYHHLTVLSNEIRELSSRHSLLQHLLSSLPSFPSFQNLLDNELAHTLYLISSVFKF